MLWNETRTDKMPPTTETRAKLIGTWQVTVTFHEGPLQGQSHTSRILFTPDHTCLILLPNPGAGTWQSDVSDAISFSFTEVLNYRADGTCTGYVIVTARGSLSQDGTSFTVSGQGEAYSADGTLVATNKTTAQGTFSHLIQDATRTNKSIERTNYMRPETASVAHSPRQ